MTFATHRRDAPWMRWRRRTTHVAAGLLALLAICLSATTARAQDGGAAQGASADDAVYAGARVALVVAAENYQSGPPRADAVVNASGVALRLALIGFEVRELYDPTDAALREAVAAFGERAADAEVSFIYLSAATASRDGDVVFLGVDADASDASGVSVVDIANAGAGAAGGSALAFDAPEASEALSAQLWVSAAPNQLCLLWPRAAVDLQDPPVDVASMFARALEQALGDGPTTLSALANRFSELFFGVSGGKPLIGGGRATTPQTLAAAQFARPELERPEPLTDLIDQFIGGDGERLREGRGQVLIDGTSGANAARDDAPTNLDTSSQIPTYPWPPETPSSIARLDLFFFELSGQADLGDVERRLTSALVGADYADHRFYAAPGGFVLATRLEEIDEDGAALPGGGRYRLPEDPRTETFAEFLSGLFFEAPPGFWRYLAIVVTDETFQLFGDSLSSGEAVERLGGGALSLPAEIADAPFSSRHRVVALIYEFRKTAEDETARLLDPGRIPPSLHLEQTGIVAGLEVQQ